MDTSNGMNHNTPKNFALQCGALIALYVSISAFITVMFGVITLSFPDAADSSWQITQAQEGIRFGIALLVVFFPTYIYLTRVINQIRRTETGTYLTLTKWLIYLSLLLGGIILLGTAVSIIYSHLEGDLTTRFFLKAAILATVIKAAFYYYYQDAKSHWQTHERQSISFGVAMTIFVLVALGLGVMQLDTPAEVREKNIDDNQIGDLQDIQWRIEDYYRGEQSLPETLDNLYSGLPKPEAPDGRAPYQYRVTGDMSYELCAEFSHDSTFEANRAHTVLEQNYNWTHQAGVYCFSRTIDNQYRQ